MEKDRAPVTRLRGERSRTYAILPELSLVLVSVAGFEQGTMVSATKRLDRQPVTRLLSEICKLEN